MPTQIIEFPSNKTEKQKQEKIIELELAILRKELELLTTETPVLDEIKEIKKAESKIKLSKKQEERIKSTISIVAYSTSNADFTNTKGYLDYSRHDSVIHEATEIIKSIVEVEE